MRSQTLNKQERGEAVRTNPRFVVRSLLAAGIALITAVSPATAVIYNITGDVNDATAQDHPPFDGVGNFAPGGLTATSIDVVGLPDVVRRVYIVPFDLPALGGETISAATATLVLRSNFAPNFNGDLYGLTRTSSLSDVVATDYFAGALDGGGNTLLADNFVTPLFGTDVNEPHSVSGAGLISFLDTQYAAFGGGHDFSGNDDFVFLRVSIDSTVPQPDGNYTFFTADNTTAAFQPLLTIETVPGPVPEPTSFALLGLGALLLWRCGRGAWRT
ncbi:MAG: PEP-CTERM sorting domain-containing protein [Acidobacteria bacterium]|nr:PEP-CTERM sorting domain-containing protein [Acidobacteriota bacterium]